VEKKYGKDSTFLKINYFTHYFSMESEDFSSGKWIDWLLKFPFFLLKIGTKKEEGINDGQKSRM